MGRKFIKVDPELAKVIGVEQAYFYAFLQNLVPIWHKDQDGYMRIWTQYLADELGWGHMRISRIRGELVNLRLIDYQQGKNQNEAPKYKVL